MGYTTFGSWDVVGSPRTQWALGPLGVRLVEWGQGNPSLLSLSTEEVEAPEVEPRLVYCYPVRLAVSAPPMPSVEMHMENNVVCIRYKGEMVKVSRNYFSKLVRAAGRGRQVPTGGRSEGWIFLEPESLARGQGRGRALCRSPLLSVPQWLLYRYSCVDDSAFERFLPRVWCLLRRYQVQAWGSRGGRLLAGRLRPRR